MKQLDRYSFFINYYATFYKQGREIKDFAASNSDINFLTGFVAEVERKNPGVKGFINAKLEFNI